MAASDYFSDDHESPSPRRSSSSKHKLPVEDKLNKRRDQNRISQRAFRQRKEKHTKELEQKVEELETLLETASQENSIAASQMSRMEQELQYYRRLLFSDTGKASNSFSASPSSDASYSSAYSSTTSYQAGLGTGTKPLPYLAGYTPSPYTYAAVGGSTYSTNSSTRDATPDSPSSSNFEYAPSPVMGNASTWLATDSYKAGGGGDDAYLAFDTSQPAQGYGWQDNSNQW